MQISSAEVRLLPQGLVLFHVGSNCRCPLHIAFKEIGWFSRTVLYFHSGFVIIQYSFV
jgi:hypothetical protein